MRTGRETREEDKARFGVSRELSERVKQILGHAPGIIFEQVRQRVFVQAEAVGEIDNGRQALLELPGICGPDLTRGHR